VTTSEVDSSNAMTARYDVMTSLEHSLRYTTLLHYRSAITEIVQQVSLSVYLPYFVET